MKNTPVYVVVSKREDTVLRSGGGVAIGIDGILTRTPAAISLQ
jgi:hypothetical protein